MYSLLAFGIPSWRRNVLSSRTSGSWTVFYSLWSAFTYTCL